MQFFYHTRTQSTTLHLIDHMQLLCDKCIEKSTLVALGLMSDQLLKYKENTLNLLLDFFRKVERNKYTF